MRGTIRIKNINAFIDGDIDYLHEKLKVRVPGYYWMPAYQSGQWDGYYRFVNRRGFFPSGLVFAFPEYFKDYQIIDERSTFLKGWLKRDIPVVDKFGDIELRDYQIEAVKVAIENRRGILNLATNAGKTEVAISVVESLSRVFPLRALFIVHRQVLLKQAIERFKERIGVLPGQIGAGEIRDSGNDIVIATVQSLWNLAQKNRAKVRKYFERFEMVFWDEVHHMKSDTWYQIAKMIPAYFRFGLTATVPDVNSLAYWKLASMTGPILYKLKQSTLVARGYSAIPYLFLVDYYDSGDGRYIYYQDIVKHEIVENGARNEAIALVVKKGIEMGKKIVVLTNYVQHALRIVDAVAFLVKESNPVMLTGADNIEKRMKYIQQFKNGIVNPLVLTNWFDEGADVPEIEMFILASGGKADRSIIQRIGRAMRKKEGENKVIIIDFMDRVKYLKEHTRKRIRIYEQEGMKPVKIKLSELDKIEEIIKTGG